MNVKNLQLALVALSILVLFALAGCGGAENASLAKGASTSDSLDRDTAGELVVFQVHVDDARELVGVDLRGVLQTGILRVQFVTQDGTAVWQEEASGPQVLAINTVIEPPYEGDYELGLAWDGPVTASYNLMWQPGKIEVGRVTPVALISGLGMIAVAAGFIIYAALQKLGWRYLGLGALAWLVAVVLKLIWALAFNETVYSTLQSVVPESLADPLFALYVGALTGIFEVLLIWLVMRYTRLGQMTWNHALAFGIGFGVVEALLLGAQSLASAVVAIAMPAMVPLGPDAVAQLNHPLYQLAPVVERFFAVLLHIFGSLLIIYSVRSRQVRWFWLAFAYKTGIDTVAALAQIRGWVVFPTLWAVEAVVAVWGIAGLLGIRWLHQRWDDSTMGQKDLAAAEVDSRVR